MTDEDQGGLYARGGYDVGGSPGWDALVASHGALYGNDSAAGGLDRTAAGLPGKGRAGIPQQASQHQMLQPAHMPTQQQTGLQQAGGLLSNAENGYKGLKSAQGAWGDAQKGLQGLTGGAPAAAPAVTAAAPPPADAPTPTPADGDALARGGLIHRDSGGQTDGGDPENLYQSAGGLDIPNQSSNYHLPNTTSSNSGGSGGSGLSSALGLVKDASAIPGVVSGLSSLGSGAASGLAGLLPFLALERGGRAQSAVSEGCDFARGGLADGGDPMADSSGADPNSDPDVPFTYAPLEQDVAHPGKFVTDAAPGETQLVNRGAGLAPKGTPESWAHGVDISGDQKPDPGLAPTGIAPVAAGEENAPALPTGENIPLPPTRPVGLGAAAAPAVPAASDDTTALNRAAAGDTAADPANYGPGPVGGLAPPTTGQQAIAQATPEYAGNLRIAPEVSALWPRQIGQESGGHQFGKDGRPLTSPTGAVGIAQVEPGTAPEAAALAGVPFDENRYHNDPAYNELLGKAYMQAQFEKYGDINKALAAYNAGPGAVDNAIRKGGGSWLGYLPSETQNYVASINGGGAPAGGVAGAFGNVKSSLGGLGAVAQNGTSGLAHFAQNAGQDVTKGGQEASDWVNTNQNWMIPLLTGLGTMASSNSRYLGSAVLQGLGGGAQAYAKQQADQAAIAHQRAQTGLTSSEAARVNAGTTSQLMENFKNLSYKDPATGQPMIMVAGPNGQPQAMTRQEYLEKGESYRGLDPSTAFAAGRAGNTQSPAPVYGTPAPAQLPGAGGAAGAA
ncbi:MAG: transglycosylase SLT domain-containing protein, partial [Nevskia sp.]|nr:transglycosylase SLT domain-containing protein [Nevskia sp.]